MVARICSMYKILRGEAVTSCAHMRSCLRIPVRICAHTLPPIRLSPCFCIPVLPTRLIPLEPWGGERQNRSKHTWPNWGRKGPQQNFRKRYSS